VPASVPTLDEVRQAVAEAIEPLRRELAAMRRDGQAQVVSIAEAARRLGVSRRTIERKIAQRELSSVTIGRSRRVRLADTIPPVAE
jgi:excisionase family DNA binding protein